MSSRTDRQATQFSRLDAGWTQLYTSYRNNARTRSIPFLLSKEELKAIASQPCAYCADAPREDRSFYTGRLNANAKRGTQSKSVDHYIIQRTGVDRIDSSLGYSLDNCVPCCKNCNLSKRALSVEEWKNWIRRVYVNLERTH